MIEFGTVLISFVLAGILTLWLTLRAASLTGGTGHGLQDKGGKPHGS